MKNLQLFLTGIFSTLLFCLLMSTTVFADPGTDGKIAAQAIPLDAFPPSMFYTPLSNTNSTATRTLTATITDVDGVPTSGPGLPVLYWKINAGIWHSVQGSFVSGNNYQFTFDGGANGDLISYYIVAQDGALTPNVGAYPSAGATGFTANPPACSSPPFFPSTYINNATPPVITYTPLANTDGTGNRKLTATITDADGVPTSGAGLPVLYWKRNSGTYTPATGSFVGGNNYEFTFGAGVAAGDAVSYYIVARDMASIPNIISYKSEGAIGFLPYDPPACSTPPSFPDSYLINNTPLSGDYTVGTTAFNKITGKNIYFEKEVKKVTKEIPEYEKLENNKGFTNKVIGTKKVEVEEISWIPMENGKKYEGNLHVLKSEHPEYDFPQTVNGTFATITSSVSEINFRGVSGATRFLLADPSYTTGETFPIIINIANNLPTSSNTVTFKPNTGVTATISGAVGGAALKILSSYITIDGSNTTGGTTRDLTIHNTATSASFPQVISIISSNPTPVTGSGLKNCIIINGDNGTSAITLTDNSFSGGYFNNITLDNNNIQKAFYGIYLNAVSSGTNGSGLVISNNTMNTSGANALGLCGIYVQGANGVEISGNDIGNFETSANGNDNGIWLGTGIKNAVIERNKIHSLGYTGPNNFGAQGINISSDAASANITVKNNVIYDISGYGNSYTTDLGFNPIGIYLHGTQSGINVYDNSIYLYGNTLSRYQSISAGISLGSGTTSADIRNNNIVNNLGIAGSPTSVPYGSVAIYAETGNSQFTDINYNNYYVNPTNPAGTWIKAIGQLSTTVSTTLSNWKTATGKDAYSVSDDPGFTSTTNLLPDNTNINSWNVFKKGIQIASINNDYPGSSRSTTSAGGPVCIGAYEFATPTVAPPLLTVTSPAGGSTSNFIQSGRPVMDITWGALLDKGTNPQNKNALILPGTVTVQKYSGIPSPVSKTKLGKGYWKTTVDAEPTNPVSIKIHFGDEELGNITNPQTNIILSMYRALTGQWVSFPAGTGNLQSNVDWANRTITVTGIGGTDRLLLNNAEYMLTDGTDVLDTDFPIITYTPLGNTSGTGARVLSTTITDAVSGVPTSGTGLPVLYWKINTGSYTAATAAHISGNNYEFTFGAGVAGGDIVSYYIVAQDLAATPNVGSYPLTGASGFTANPPAASTPPTTPSSYHVDITPPSISYTPLGTTSSTSARVLITTITDALSGVPTSGTGLPVLYWKINAGVYTAATGTFVSGNEYTFTFGAGVIGGDIVSYYIVAQDGAVTPNVGAYPSLGASGFTANPPAASTPPTTPGSYLVNTAPVISYTPLADINATGNRTLTATITDADGVPTSGAGLPVLYWNRNTDAYTGVQATSLGSNQYSFTFGGGVSIGDLIHYYIVARDMTTPTPNITSYKLEGASGFTYDPPACSTPPTSPDYYLINSQSLSGDYTVGTTAFNKITGKQIYFEKEVNKNTKEISWIPMENGKKYDGKLYVLKSEHPEYDFPQTVNGTFISITSAVSALNYQGVSGAVRFLLADPSYTTGETFPIVINIANNLPTSSNTVTIKPNVSNTAAITSASGTGPVFRIVSDYVTIDGSNTNNGTTRDLTITKNVSSGTSAIQFISQGTTPVTGSGIKNCNIINSENSTSAITLTDNSLSGGYFNNITLQNNDIQKALYGIYINAVATGTNGSGLIISNNTMNTSGANALGLCGIYVQGANGAEISGNDIGNFETLTDGNDIGIWLGTGIKNAVIERNKIHSLGYTGPNNYAAQGINISSDEAAANITVKNNMIYNISGYGNSYITNPGYNPMGIYLHGTQSGINVYYNSIYLYGNTLGRDHAISAGIGLGGTTSADIRNNNIVNNLGIDPSHINIAVWGSLGIYAETGNSQFIDINYNNYYVNPTSLGGPWVQAIGQLSADTSTTLSDWKTATGKDVNSVSGDPKYLGVTDLHIQTSVVSPVSNAGTYIASVLDDFDSDVRSVTTPDIGADEYTYSPNLSLNLTAMLSGYCNGTTMNYTKNVTVELHNSTAPHALVESKTFTLSTSGAGNPLFTTAVNGTPYYIVLKFNNGLETWSATPQTFTGSTLNYDFTTAATQAYGSNMLLVGTKWCIISGDADQNGTVNALDRSLCWNDRNLVGVYATDLDGNGTVNALDRSIAWNNRNLSVAKPALVLSPERGIKQDNKGNNGNTKGTFDLRLDGSNSKKVKKINN